ncbi:glycoside hydrolase family 15 protein [Hyalangium versicolor]|uniref:glycoside hydrolase family 15 protein n=1 Tax=Hyalangium versicolor TaxID=2861190 RepID=UPI001CCA22C3|nr:glycoside hydrolase family 15 protein [Hyalangium versicolor]
MGFSFFGTRALGVVVLLLSLGWLPGCAGSIAPGQPGAPALWTPADKHGFGSARSEQSKVWYTLGSGELTEVFYPTLGSPSVRELYFVVSDGHSFAESELDATEHHIELTDPRSLTYRQVNTARSGKYRLTKTYVTDPQRHTVLFDLRFESLSGEPYALYVVFDPSLANDGMNDSGTSENGVLLAEDGSAASALLAQPAFEKTSSGYLGTSDGWTDLYGDFVMNWDYRSAPEGNVVQTGRLSVNGLGQRQSATLVLGFGTTAQEAREAARGSQKEGFAQVARKYAEGWHTWLGSLPPAPASAEQWLTTYDVSLMVMAASEDKTYRGAFIASPSMPWAWGLGLENPSGAYHLVWSRDLYQIATALLAAGDKPAADRALDHLFNVQQKPDGSFPQNATVEGTPHWTNLQLDEVALPIVLAWQLGRADARTYSDHVKKAADFLVANGPVSPQDRWENQSGYSPGTIAAEIAGLICAADLARRNGDTASAASYEATADSWQHQVEGWTVTTNGPLAPHPYYLRLTKDGNPNAGTTYSLGDGGPSAMDQRRMVDASFLELVRLGVKSASDSAITQSLPVIDTQLKVETPSGTFWRRYDFDGYGETPEGGPWEISEPDTGKTLGRAWPIFAGERGEYALSAGQPADTWLAAMARSGNEGYLLPEQVWDGRPPSGQPGFVAGKGTFSATPLVWSHAQFVRLAWSILAGYPIEQPSLVACRYTSVCRKQR